MYIACQQLKPFNPILGETFQGELPNGAKLYVENVTNKPLVARFLLTYKKIYEISGYFDLSVKTQSFGNEMLILQKGPVYIKFPEINECIICNLPGIRVINARNEKKRALLFFGQIVYVDVKNKLKCIIKYNVNKDIFHEVKGCLLEYDYPPDYQYSFDKEWEFGSSFKFDDKKSKKNYRLIETISGSWTKNLFIGNKKVWDIFENIPEHIRPVKHCLPSDGRFREDLIWLYRSFYNSKNEEEEKIYRNISMNWKVMMEEYVRYDRKNRANYKELMEKKKK
jgi:hypothetical protein